MNCVALTPTAAAAQIYKLKVPDIKAYTYHSFLIKIGYSGKGFRVGQGFNEIESS